MMDPNFAPLACVILGASALMGLVGLYHERRRRFPRRHR